MVWEGAGKESTSLPKNDFSDPLCLSSSYINSSSVPLSIPGEKVRAGSASPSSNKGGRVRERSVPVRSGGATRRMTFSSTSLVK